MSDTIFTGALTPHLVLNVGLALLLLLICGACLQAFAERRRRRAVHVWYSYAVVITRHGAYVLDEQAGDRPMDGGLVLRRGLAQGQAYHMAMTLKDALKVADAAQAGNDYALASPSNPYIQL